MISYRTEGCSYRRLRPYHQGTLYIQTLDDLALSQCNYCTRQKILSRICPLLSPFGLVLLQSLSLSSECIVLDQIEQQTLHALVAFQAREDLALQLVRD